MRNQTAAPAIEINLLGIFQVLIDGMPVKARRWQRRKAKPLLIILALPQGKMKAYGSFLLHCWVIKELSEGERLVFDIEPVQTGARERLDNLAEARDWMREKCQAPSTQTNHKRKVI